MLLSISRDVKTSKGEQAGFLTGILYLAPYNLSGKQLCPMADKAGCANACLNTAGRGVFSNVQRARLNKTRFFLDNTQEFMEQLSKDIEFLQRKAEKLNMIPLVRLNGTSDIVFEKIKFKRNGETLNIFEAFPGLQFYDYTKIYNRTPPKNYDLTFSYSNRPEYQKYVQRALAKGMRVAAVFKDRKTIPITFLGRPCVDGDNTDIRHLDPVDSVVALYAKGRARKDTGGFVVS